MVPVLTTDTARTGPADPCSARETTVKSVMNRISARPPGHRETQHAQGRRRLPKKSVTLITRRVT